MLVYDFDGASDLETYLETLPKTKTWFVVTTNNSYTGELKNLMSALCFIIQIASNSESSRIQIAFHIDAPYIIAIRGRKWWSNSWSAWRKISS